MTNILGESKMRDFSKDQMSTLEMFYNCTVFELP